MEPIANSLPRPICDTQVYKFWTQYIAPVWGGGILACSETLYSPVQPIFRSMPPPCSRLAWPYCSGPVDPLAATPLQRARLLLSCEGGQDGILEFKNCPQLF